MALQKRVQLMMDVDLLKRVDAEAEKQGMNRSEFTRMALEEKLSTNGAIDGVDTTMRLLRKLLQDEVNPQFNRMAKMIARNTKAAATGMYLHVLGMDKANKKEAVDVVAAFRDSESKAAQYLISKD